MKLYKEKIGGHKGEYALYKDKYKARARKYETTEKGKQARKTSKLNRRAREYNAIGKITSIQIKALYSYYAPNSICPSCKKQVKMTLDHVIPLSKEGQHRISNMQPLCDICNKKKQATTIDYRYDKGKFAKFIEEQL